MAKETFHRTKPHVNVGTIGNVLDDTSGELVLNVSGSEEQNDPEANVILFFSAPPSEIPQRAIVGFPFDEAWQYVPRPDAPVLSVEWQLELMPTRIDGADLHVTLAVLQNDAYYFAPLAGDTIGPGAEWLSLGDAVLAADDLVAIDGSPGRVDFAEPFGFGYAFAADYSTQGLAVEIELDQMQVEITAVPEPSSLVLVGALGATLLLTRWRR